MTEEPRPDLVSEALSALEAAGVSRRTAWTALQRTRTIKSVRAYDAAKARFDRCSDKYMAALDDEAALDNNDD